MTYKTILVHVDNGKRSPARVEVAAELAGRFDAHLVGLHAVTPPEARAYRTIAAGPAVIEDQRQRGLEQAKQAETLFRRAVDKAGVRDAEWRASSGDPVAGAALHSRYADLVVLGQPDLQDDSDVEPAFAQRLVLMAGRPALVVPYIGPASTLGKRVLLAWSATREATRAATDALPFLQAADEVWVVIVRPSRASHGELPGADIGLYLARHGVKVQVEAIEGTEIDAGNQLLSRAADRSSDMIVMGAYGHSRFSEMVLGGATRKIFESMTVPVLMSH
ncbi:MAG TPA: universal stress protein [Casimicrobiaceae bacterium]|nr:universal stress protein [Casimicrobiaceae bacterium]